MKGIKVQIIEERHYSLENLRTDCKFSLVFKPNGFSLDIRVYEKNYSFSDLELDIGVDKNLLNHMREEAAVEVFRQFYQDHFITKKV